VITDPSLSCIIQRILQINDLGFVQSTLGRVVSAKALRHCRTHMLETSEGFCKRLRYGSACFALQPSTPVQAPSCSPVLSCHSSVSIWHYLRCQV